MVLALHMCKMVRQIAQQFLLRLLLAHHGRHLPSQVSHDEDMDFCCSYSLHKLIHLPDAITLRWDGIRQWALYGERGMQQQGVKYTAPRCKALGNLLIIACTLQGHEMPYLQGL